MKLSAKAKQSLDKVITQFQSGDLSPIAKIFRIRLSEDAPARRWSLSNKVISFVQSGELDCRGFRQWEKAGRKIKKGSKAAFILRPVTIKTKDQKDEANQDYICIGFSSTPVFAASSTEGETPLPAYEPKELPALVDIAKSYGVSVSFVPVGPDRLGDCTPDGKQIRIGTHNPSVFFHELAHAMHARLVGKLKGKQSEDQETVAELTSSVLMNLYGYGDHTGNAWKYISHYSKDPLVAITKALATVEKVLQLLEGEAVDNI